MDTGEAVTPEMVRTVADQELGRMREEFGDEIFGAGRFREAADLFDQVALADTFPEFLTLPAYDHLSSNP
jgi:malate synthase